MGGIQLHSKYNVIKSSKGNFRAIFRPVEQSGILRNDVRYVSAGTIHSIPIPEHF